jgi:hypothetical protein
MKLHWSNKTGLLVGLALIAATNAIALAGVAYNRSGETESALALTERELPVVNWSWPDNDNSSIDLRLQWRVKQTYSPDHDYGRWSDDWLSEEQLRSLGFNTSLPAQMYDELPRHPRDPSKMVFFALEYDGPAYQEALEQHRKRVEHLTELATRNAGDPTFEARLKGVREVLANEEESASRLFVIDASLDRDELRKRYPDRTRYAILRGRLSTHVAGEPGKQRIAAGRPELAIEHIRVPHSYRALVEPLRDGRRYSYNEVPPRFSATVNVGRRLEPWIVSMHGI